MNLKAGLALASAVVATATACTETTIAAVSDDETVVVSSVTDGDTFRVGARRIRVLGINSCEIKTLGGKRAKTEAADLLDGPVTLSREPGVDRDRYGRELRYVIVHGRDFGSVMVTQDHTEVYQGRNDASSEYVARLRKLDADGRNCDR